ncbi:MAG: hypothetical protein AB1779_00460 [Candidatus Thermoplasmatota archaeon]
MKKYIIGIIGLLLLAILIGIGLNASAADGSGTNTVSPTSATAGSTGNTFTFTFTAAESMDSGAISITAPTGWSAPQGSSGTAGYTVITTSNGTAGDVVSSLDSTTGWGGGTGYTLSSNTTVLKEGTASLQCNIPANTASGKWYYNFSLAQDWSSYTIISFWIYSTLATASTDFDFAIAEDLNLATPSDTFDVPALTANTWTYVKWTFGGATTTRDAVLSYGFINNSALASDVIILADEILIGPGKPTFSGQDISVRILAMTTNEVINVSYGSGGGASGVTVTNCVATLELTTKSRVSVTGTLTAIASSPTVTINPATMTRLVITLPGETFTPCSGNSGTVTAQTAGTSFNLVGINATDDYFNVVTSYTGTKTLTYSGPGSAGGSNPSYTTSVDFTNGQSTTTPLATTLYKAETTTITVTDAGSYGYASSSLTVNPGAMTRLVITLPGETFTPASGNSGTVAAQTAGTTFNLVGINATDNWFNVVTTYSGAKTLTYSGPGSAGGSNPSYTTSVDFTNGQSTTVLATTLYKAETTTITVTDGGQYGYASSSLTVNPGAMTRLVITLPGETFTPTSGNSGTVTAQTAGTSFNLVGINATDNWFNVVTTYSGAKTLTYSGPGNAPNGQAPSYTTTVDFTNGQSTTTPLATTLYKAETVQITVTDAGAYGYASSSLTVNPSSHAKYLVSAGSPQTAGIAFAVTVKAADQYDNVITNINDTLNSYSFSWSGASNAPNGEAPDYTFVGSFTDGISTFPTRLKKNETVILTVQDNQATPKSGTSNSIIVKYASIDHLGLNTSLTKTAGVASDINVTAHDKYNNVVDNYTGTIHFTTNAQNGPEAGIVTLPSDYTFLASDKGIKNFTDGVILYRVETNIWINASDGTVHGNITGINVLVAQTNHFHVYAGTTQTAGVAFNIDVIVHDSYGNLVTNYTGTIKFTTNDGNSPNGYSPVLPSDYTFTVSDGGTKTFSAILYNAGSNIWIKAEDISNASINGTQLVLVKWTIPSVLLVTSGTYQIAGVAFNISVRVIDSYGNTVEDYTGTINFTTSAGVQKGYSPILPSNYTFLSSDKGIKMFVNGVILYRAEDNVFITAKDNVTTSITGSQTGIKVDHSSLSSLSLSASTTQVAGISFIIFVTALDSYGNVYDDYLGTVNFASNAGISPKNYAPGIPADYTYTSGDKGVHEFTITFYLAETGVWLNVSDKAMPTIYGNLTGITVKPSTLDSFTATGYPSETVAGTLFTTDITVKAYDLYGNLKTDYTGSVYFTSTDSKASLPYNLSNKYTFTLTDNGVKVFSANGFSLKTTPTQTITITDGLISNTSAQIIVKPSTAHHIIISSTGTYIAGLEFNITVEIKDEFENRKTDYTGTINFTSNALDGLESGVVSLPSNYTFSIGDNGIKNFTITLYRAQKDVWIFIKDNVTSSINGTLLIDVKNSYPHHLHIEGAPEQIAGISFNLTIIVHDIYGNTVENYTGKVTFSSNASASPRGDNPILPQNYTFLLEDKGIHKFVYETTLFKVEKIYIKARDSSDVNGTIEINVNPGSANHFHISCELNQIAGIEFDITVEIHDAYDNRKIDYTGDIIISTTAGNAPIGTTPDLPRSPNFVRSDEGIKTFKITLYLAEENVVIAVADKTDPSILGSCTGIKVLYNKVVSFDVIANTTQIAGIPVFLKIVAMDYWHNVVKNYTGTITISGNANIALDGTQPYYGGPYSFDASWNGVLILTNVTLYRAEENVYLRVDDTKGINGTKRWITVRFGSPNSLYLTANLVQIAGIPFEINVTVRDKWYNTVTDYIGKVSLTGTASNAPDGTPPIYASPYNYTLIDLGRHVFGGNIFYNAEYVTVIASDTNLNGSITIYVTHNTIAQFGLYCKKEQVAGEEFNLSINALDMWGNIVKNYMGTVMIETTASNAPDGTKPSYIDIYKFTIGDNGTKKLTFLLYNAEENVKITVKDIVKTTVKGSIDGINVSFGYIHSFGISTSTVQIAGIEFEVLISALDKWNNIVENYTGMVFIENKSIGIYKEHTFMLDEKGVALEKLTIYTASENATIYCRDENGITGIVGLKIKPGNAEKFNITANLVQIAGKEFSIYVKVLDKWSNIVTNYTGVLSITISAGIANDGTKPRYTSSISIISKGEFEIANIVLYKAEKNVNITISSKNVFGYIWGIEVLHSTIYTLNIITEKEQKAGESHDITVEAWDKWQNLVSYDGTISFVTTAKSSQKGNAPVLPLDYTFRSEKTHTFKGGLKFFKAETEVVITVFDKENETIFGSIKGIKVSYGKPNELRIETGLKQKAGVAFDVMITVLDAWWNIVENYTGTVTINSTARYIAGVEPKYGSTTFTPEDMGIKVIEGIIFYKAEDGVLLFASGKYGLKGYLANITVEDDVKPTKANLFVKRTIEGKEIIISWSVCEELDFWKYELYQSTTKDRLGELIKVTYNRYETDCTMRIGDEKYYYTLVTYDINNNSIASEQTSVEQLEKYPYIQTAWLILAIAIIVALAAGIYLLRRKPEIPPVEEKIPKKEELEYLCQICSAQIPKDAEKCPKCGAEFVEEVVEEEYACPICGTSVDALAKKCPKCDAEFE